MATALLLGRGKFITVENESKSEGHNFVADPGDAGLRLDRFLVERLEGVSRSRVQNAIRDGHVELNAGPAKASDSLKPGDEVAWNEPPPRAMDSAQAEDLPLEILFEDKWLIIVNKASGMVVHPGAGNTNGTLVSALLYHGTQLSSSGGDARPGIVHRLDKETSGCLVVAKSDEVHALLSSLFEARKVSKTYVAAVEGRLRKPSGVVEATIGRHHVHRQKMAIVSEAKGREAITEYRMLGMLDGISLVECKPRTGRTHQIRVHLKHLGCPVLGDAVYGQRGEYSRHLLHAWKLAFQHPKTGVPIAAEAPIPADFREALPPAIQKMISELRKP